MGYAWVLDLLCLMVNRPIDDSMPYDVGRSRQGYRAAE